MLGAEHRGDLSGHRLVTKRVLRGAEDEAWFCSLLVGKVAAFVTMFGRLGLSPADRRGGRRRQSKLTTGRYTAAGNEEIRFQPAQFRRPKTRLHRLSQSVYTTAGVSMTACSWSHSLQTSRFIPATPSAADSASVMARVHMRVEAQLEWRDRR